MIGGAQPELAPPRRVLPIVASTARCAAPGRAGQEPLP